MAHGEVWRQLEDQRSHEACHGYSTHELALKSLPPQCDKNHFISHMRFLCVLQVDSLITWGNQPSWDSCRGISANQGLLNQE